MRSSRENDFGIVNTVHILKYNYRSIPLPQTLV